eukprot:c20395_g2_i1 orf=695-937(+)
MPILAGAIIKSLPWSPRKSDKKSTDMANTESQPGTSGVCYGVSSPRGNLFRQFSNKSFYDDSDDDGDGEEIQDFVLGPLI